MRAHPLYSIAPAGVDDANSEPSKVFNSSFVTEIGKIYDNLQRDSLKAQEDLEDRFEVDLTLLQSRHEKLLDAVKAHVWTFLEGKERAYILERLASVCPYPTMRPYKYYSYSYSDEVQFQRHLDANKRVWPEVFQILGGQRLLFT